MCHSKICNADQRIMRENAESSGVTIREKTQISVDLCPFAVCFRTSRFCPLLVAFERFP